MNVLEPFGVITIGWSKHILFDAQRAKANAQGQISKSCFGGTLHPSFLPIYLQWNAVKVTTKVQ